MENDKLPYISVIITAYNRKEYLLNAIKSVINQTLDKKYYEIIVIKNFNDKNIDDFINENKIISIISNQESLLGKIIEALNIANGNVISFLEDDDLFLKNKLEIVYNKFKKDNNIVYYHNLYVPVNSNKKPIKNNNGKTINANGMNTYPDINMSSISIKKSIVKINGADKIDIAINIALDRLMYLYALESSKKIIKGKEKLTHYMFHNSASTIVSNNFEEYRKSLINQLNLNLNSYTFFNNLFHSRKAVNVLNSYITGIQIQKYILESNEFPGKLINYVINSTGNLKYRISFFLLCILIKVYPKSRKYIGNKMWNIRIKWSNI